MLLCIIEWSNLSSIANIKFCVYDCSSYFLFGVYKKDDNIHVLLNSYMKPCQQFGAEWRHISILKRVSRHCVLRQFSV